MISNKKNGQIALTGTGVLAIVGIIIILILLAMGGYILYLEDQKYNKQFEYGTSLLNNLSIYTTYIDPEKGLTTGFVFALINSSSNVESMYVHPTYTAYNFDRSKKLNLYKGEKEPLKLSHSFHNQPVDTLEVYSKLGNEAKVCATILTEYQGTNWIDRFKGKAKRALEDCKNLIADFE